MCPDERYFIEHVLAFFAQSDNIVLENLMSNFSKELQIPEGRSFYAVQGYAETVHAETYARHIQTLITDIQRQNELFNAISTIPCVSKKAKWALKWMDPKKATFAQRLVAFAVVEGVFFSGSFCAIFWLQSRGLMDKGIGKSNEFIARDESMHCEFARVLYKYVVNKLSTEIIHKIFEEAIEIEIEFITESLPCRLIGMNSDLMIQYIKFVANYWLVKFGYSELYSGIDNPFSFMLLNDLEGKSNFFEIPPSEYSKAHSVSSASDRKIEKTDDF
jgi:ribonucleoside-diphosphate reductase beta chain